MKTVACKEDCVFIDFDNQGVFDDYFLQLLVKRFLS